MTNYPEAISHSAYLSTCRLAVNDFPETTNPREKKLSVSQEMLHSSLLASTRFVSSLLATDFYTTTDSN